MQREIKFKAWHKEKQMMCPIIAIGLMDNWIELEPSPDSSWVTDLTDVILLQYTGVKDKNNKEIYDGDIVRFSAHYFGDSWNTESTEVIEWYTCQWNDNLWVGYMDKPEWCEVIGNIHQNSDLIK